MSRVKVRCGFLRTLGGNTRPDAAVQWQSSGRPYRIAEHVNLDQPAPVSSVAAPVSFGDE
jgi:hypothetical protein